MPKKALWFVAAGIAGLLYVTWHAGRLPARVTLLNQSDAPILEAVMTTSGGAINIGTLRGGESRAFSVPPTEQLRLTYRWRGEERQWRAIQPISAAQSLALYVTPAGRVAPRNKMGTIER